MTFKDFVVGLALVTGVVGITGYLGHGCLSCMREENAAQERARQESEAKAKREQEIKERSKQLCIPFEQVNLFEVDKKNFTVCRSDKSETGFVLIEVK